jgi:hypothetical protein
MKIWKTLFGVPILLISSHAIAENWVNVATADDLTKYDLDKDSIRRGSDGLVYYTESKTGEDGYVTDDAVDCQRSMIYLVKDQDGFDVTDWRNHGNAIKAGSISERELQYVCANVR